MSADAAAAPAQSATSVPDVSESAQTADTRIAALPSTSAQPDYSLPTPLRSIENLSSDSPSISKPAEQLKPSTTTTSTAVNNSQNVQHLSLSDVSTSSCADAAAAATSGLEGAVGGSCDVSAPSRQVPAEFLGDTVETEVRKMLLSLQKQTLRSIAVWVLFFA